MNFWENVERIREYKEISRKELALRANFSLNSISTGISRNSIPLADVACRIADVLEVSVEFLVTGKSSRKEINSEEKKIEEQLENKKENFKKARDLVKEATCNGANLILFPEMSFTGFSMNVNVTKEKDEITLKYVKGLAREFSVAIGVGWVKEREEKAENHFHRDKVWNGVKICCKISISERCHRKCF